MFKFVIIIPYDFCLGRFDIKQSVSVLYDYTKDEMRYFSRAIFTFLIADQTKSMRHRHTRGLSKDSVDMWRY